MNKQLLLAKRPVGVPDEDTWDLVETAIPTVGEGQCLLKNIYVSLDPAMRGWMRDRASYLPPVALGDVMRAGTVSQVVESTLDHMPKGSYWQGMGGVQQFVLSNGKGWYPADPQIAPLPQFLNVLGIAGYTAYFGLLSIGQPKEGETVLVSGAAGSVGSLVGQIARIKGCRVVGIAGTDEKCNYLTEELGWDAAINYKTDNVLKSIGTGCPDKVDIYFDNVGGPILDAALAHLNFKGRVVLCGGISQYNATDSFYAPKNYLSLLVNRGRMEGFIIFDFAKKYLEAARDMVGWMQEGKIKGEYSIYNGIENFRENFLRLFSGDKRGKVILKIDE